MATKNRRVAAYLPPQVDKAFVEFKIKRGLATDESSNQNDSQALVELLSEFLGVTHQVEHPVSRQLDIEMAIQLEDLKAELVGQIGELSSELLILRQRVDALASAQDLAKTLTTGEMADRIGISSSTLSHWKTKKTPEQMKEAIKGKDPEGLEWVYLPDSNLFKKGSDIPDGLQGSLPVQP